MMRNDLEAPALGIAPVIAEVRQAISAQPGCRIARMSGSGATCFGLFDDPLSASAAAQSLKRRQPGCGWSRPRSAGVDQATGAKSLRA